MRAFALVAIAVVAAFTLAMILVTINPGFLILFFIMGIFAAAVAVAVLVAKIVSVCIARSGPGKPGEGP